MIDPVSLIGFGGASLAIALSPGASWMFVISNAVSQGPAGGRAAIAGNATGILGHTVMAALGLSALIAYSTEVYATVRWLGAIYLIYLAARTIRQPSPFTGSVDGGPGVPLLTIYRQGIVMNLLNPKVALLMVALLPQFLSPTTAPLHFQIAILGLLHALIASVVLSILSLLVDRAAPTIYNSPRLERTFRWLSATVLFALGTRTALDV